MREYATPAAIERASMDIITAELRARGVVLSPPEDGIIRRVIHATADFDYVRALHFTPEATEQGAVAVTGGVIVTDTNMALAGISKLALQRLGTSAYCFMAEEFIAREAQERESTRAAVSMEYALSRYPAAVLAVGNAPTALLRIADLIESGARPALVIGAPVGFVNVVESKERLWTVCRRAHVPAIVAMGRKGGSGVAAAICNALVYLAADLADPEKRL